jgi:type II secretory pathway pseudopilin PulG
MNANANMQAQAAYGRAIQQQRQNISGAWKSLADAGGMAAGYGMMGMGSPKAAAATTPAASGYTTAPSVETAVKGATAPGNNWLWDYNGGMQAPPNTYSDPNIYQMDPNQINPSVTSNPLFNPALNSMGSNNFSYSSPARPYGSYFKQ